MVLRASRWNFNPRTPCGVRPNRIEFVLTFPVFQSTHPLRGATPRRRRPRRARGISIHAPLAGCDAGETPSTIFLLSFQSTHPLRGATPLSQLRQLHAHISIHAPLAGCDPPVIMRSLGLSNFNPRTPCGVRQIRCTTRITRSVFQSTHPLRGATAVFFGQISLGAISIHAPLAGCDAEELVVRARALDFNPRTPCGVRPTTCCAGSKTWSFQSTHPLRGATLDKVRRQHLIRISIHAPLAGCDLVSSKPC